MKTSDKKILHQIDCYKELVSLFPFMMEIIIHRIKTFALYQNNFCC